MHLIEIPATGLPPLLGTEVSAYVKQMVKANQDFYRTIGFRPPWVAYLAEEEGGIVGTCGFKGAPDPDRVEIAYHCFPDHEGSGVATRMAAQLVLLAKAQDPTLRITAQTLPEANASTRVLAKNGFVQMGEVTDDEVGRAWEWELRTGANAR